MPDSVINAAITELSDALNKLRPEYEGFLDIGRMLAAPDENTARAAIGLLAGKHQMRVARVANALTLLTELRDSGYPTSDPYVLPPEVLEKVLENRGTLQAALTLLVPASEATSADVTIGQPVPR